MFVDITLCDELRRETGTIALAVGSIESICDAVGICHIYMSSGVKWKTATSRREVEERIQLAWINRHASGDTKAG